MYDELINALRRLSDWSIMDFEDNLSYANQIAEEAADAIEELSKPHWIPVTERLPKEEKKIYWCCTNMGIMCECRWTNNRWGLGESEKWGWNIMDVPQYQKVTHWMPLPQPPKEEQT